MGKRLSEKDRAMNDAHKGSRPLPRAKIGKTDLEVTKLGFGTVALGILPDEEQEIGREAVRRAYAHGLTFFDTAPYYGNGKAERRLGEALRGVDRSTYVIGTKVGRVVPLDSETYPKGWQPAFDYSYDAVFRTYETSLKRLGVDRVDVVLLHDIGAVTHGDRHPELFKQAMDGGYRALAELKSEGAISAIGVGVNEWQVLEEAMGAADFDVFLLAGRYTLLEQTALDSFLPLCERRNISVLVGGPFNSGILAKGPSPGVWYNYTAAPEPILERVRRIEKVCARYGVSLPAAALRFPVAHPAVTSVVFGPRSADEALTNLDQFETYIDPELWSALKRENLLRSDAPTP
jgi:D-threo-aldose 1-dehydrogenase